jgi:hypothetical protein
MSINQLVPPEQFGCNQPKDNLVLRTLSFAMLQNMKSIDAAPCLDDSNKKKSIQLALQSYFDAFFKLSNMWSPSVLENSCSVVLRFGHDLGACVELSEDDVNRLWTSAASLSF